MAIENNSVFIVISEEAYKQNTVYRPWKEIRTSDIAPPPKSVQVTSQWKAAK
ncbi:MAG: hypothetical protein ACI9JM_000301 [Halioglobus sp.]|jgi:hypothetical protein